MDGIIYWEKITNWE